MFNIHRDALTPAQVEERTGFTLATLATWRSRGRGPKFIKLMGRVYYLKTDFEAWLNEQIKVA